MRVGWFDPVGPVEGNAKEKEHGLDDRVEEPEGDTRERAGLEHAVVDINSNATLPSRFSDLTFNLPIEVHRGILLGRFPTASHDVSRFSLDPCANELAASLIFDIGSILFFGLLCRGAGLGIGGYRTEQAHTGNREAESRPPTRTTGPYRRFPT